MMAAARLVVQCNQLAVAHDTHPGRTAADVDNRSVADVEQGLCRAHLIGQASAGDLGILKDVAAGSCLGRQYARWKGGCRGGDFATKCHGGRQFELSDGRDRACEVYDHAVLHGFAGNTIPQ